MGQVSDTTQLFTLDTVEASAESHVFLETFQTILDYHATSFSDSALWEGAIEGLLESLDDPYAYVFTPDEVADFTEANTGDYAGIGVQITELYDRVTITAVYRGTPAYEVGLMVGDQIVEVNGESSVDWTNRKASEVIRGEPGTTVEVSVAREGYPQPIPHQIRRAQVHIPAVIADMVRDSVGYIQLDRFARGAAQEVDSSLALLSGAKGYIIDLRGNPGGFLAESLNLADVFLNRRLRLASTRNRVPGAEMEEESWHARTSPRIVGKPIVILVDRYSASASEIVAGALQDHDRAVIVGEPTFGKGVVQTVLPLPAGRQLRITTGSWYTPLGRSLQRARDRSGRLIPMDPDTMPVVVTARGREILAGGGIFPDLAIEDDTLRTVERELLIAAVEAQVPLTLRLTEFGFGIAQEVREGRSQPVVDPARFDAFLEGLVEEGLPEERVSSPIAREYLMWRAEIILGNRLDDTGTEKEIQARRDVVLAEAIRLIEQAGTQDELFAAAADFRSSRTGRGGVGR